MGTHKDSQGNGRILRFVQLYWLKMLLCVVCAVAVCVVVSIYARFLSERRIASTVQSLHGVVVFEYRGPLWVPEALRSRLYMCDRIVTLNLDGVPVSAELLMEVGSLTHLTCLWIRGTSVSEEGMMYLKHLVKLENINFSNTDLSDTALENCGVQQMRRLRQVRIANTRVTDAGIGEIGRVESIVELDLGGTDVTDSGLRNLAALKHIRSLGLSNTRITDTGLVFVGDLPEIESVTLRETNVSDKGLGIVAGRMRTLKSLSLSGTAVSDAGIEDLSKLKHLEFLFVEGTRITPVGVNRIREALPNVVVFSD